MSNFIEIKVICAGIVLPLALCAGTVGMNISAADILNLSDQDLVEVVAADVTSKPSEISPQLLEAQNNLKQKDAIIAKLSSHLASALSRLNAANNTPDYSAQKLATVVAMRDQLARENASLKDNVSMLQTQVAQSNRQLQMFDMENRRLVEAVGGHNRLPVAQIAQRYLDTTSSYAAQP